MHLLLAIAILAAPLYVWRFSVFGIDANALLLVLSAVIAAFAIDIIWNKRAPAFINSVKQLSTFLMAGIALVFAASIISLLVGGFDVPKLGQWIVLYAQPLLMFLAVNFYVRQQTEAARFIRIAVYCIVGAAGVLAIAQYAFLFGLPMEWWGNSNEPKRAIAFFEHPNGYALFVTPLLAWLLPNVFARMQRFVSSITAGDGLYVMLWVLGVLGMVLSLSRGAWLGFAIASAVYAILSRNKKVIIGLAIAGIAFSGIVLATDNLRYRILLPFYGEKSAVARLSLWDTASKMISDSPITGKGIHGFNYNWEKYNTDPNLDHYNFPHNIALNFWVDLGLLGVIGFLAILLHIMKQGIRQRRTQYQLAMVLFAVAMVAHGLIDIPYLKNDLALVFWMMLGMSAASENSA